MVLLDVVARLLDQPVVLDARRAGGNARHAAEAPVEVLGDGVGERQCRHTDFEPERDGELKPITESYRYRTTLLVADRARAASRSREQQAERTDS